MIRHLFLVCGLAASLFLSCVIIAAAHASWLDSVVASPTAGVVQQVPVAKPVRVYMLHDPVKDTWYRVSLGGLSSWGAQNQGGVWTVQADVKTLLSTMLGKRPKRYKIEAFLLIPVKNNK